MIYWAINYQRLDKLSMNFTSNMCHHIKLFKDANTKIWLRTSKKDSFIQILFVNNINFHWILNKLKSHISHIPSIFTSLAFKFFCLSIPDEGTSRKSLWSHQIYKVIFFSLYFFPQQHFVSGPSVMLKILFEMCFYERVYLFLLRFDQVFLLFCNYKKSYY